MFTNEATPTTVWSAMDADLKSPLHRLYRLQSLLSTLSSALRLEGDGHLESIEIQHIATTAKFALEESKEISGGLEKWFYAHPYLSTAKKS